MTRREQQPKGIFANNRRHIKMTSAKVGFTTPYDLQPSSVRTWCEPSHHYTRTEVKIVTCLFIYLSCRIVSKRDRLEMYVRFEIVY